MKTWKAVVAALSVIGSMTVMTPAAQASPDPNLTINSVVVAATSVTAVGVDLKAVPVTVEAKYSSTDDYDPFVLEVFLRRTGGTGPAVLMIAKLPLVSGTPQTGGVWKGFLYVPSTANGTFKVIGVLPSTGVDFGDMPGFDVTPYDGQTVTVVGTHLPKFSISIIPKVVPVGSPYKIRATVYDSATGLSYGKPIKVALSWEVGCMNDQGGTFTNAAGIVEAIFPADAANYTNCALLTTPGATMLALNWRGLRSAVVGAAPSKTSAPVGTIVPVNGTVGGPTAGCAVQLQRLIGSTQWRGVSQSKVTSSGRYRVLAQPPYAGNVIYRVAFPVCDRFQFAVSKSFVIRGL